MGTHELKQPLGASIIRALGLAGGDIPKFILAELEREWDRSAFFTIYATFTDPTCPGGTGDQGKDKKSDKPRQVDEKTCCKYEAISTSPEEKSKVSIKVKADDWGELEIGGTVSIRPQIVNEAHIKPDGDCPGKCRDESIQIVIQLIYHFSLHFKLQLLGKGLAAGANFKYPVKADNTKKAGTSAQVDIEFDLEGDAHDSLMVFADCESITTNNKEKRPWLDNLPGSGASGAPVHKPIHPPHAPLALGDCNVRVVGNLLGFTQSGRGGRVTIDMTPSVGGVPQMPPQATYPVSGMGGITQRQFTIWAGAVSMGCASWFEVNAVFDFELFNHGGQSIDKERVLVKVLVFCPEENKIQFVRPVTFHGKAHLRLYVRVDLVCQ